MEQYVKVEKPKVETPIDENEIRITSQGRMRSYISYALTLLQEKDANEIVFKAMGRAINKTVTIVELIKRRVVGLHQITSIGSTDITDTWEPLEEGLLPLETTRHVSMITIILSKSDVVDTSAVGYQPPLPADQVKAANDYDYDGGEGSPSARGRGRGGRGRGRRGRGRGRGPAGNGFPAVEYEDGGYEQNASFPRGRGRGRGRSFRGRGRGGFGYNGPVDDNQQYDAGYNRAPQGGRGRGGYNNYNAPVEDNQQYDGGYNRGPPSQGGRGRGGYSYNGPVDDNQQFDGGFNRGRGRSRGRGGRGRGGRSGRSNGPAQAVAGDA